MHEYDFVNGTLVDAATLERAVGLARRWNVTPHDVLLANGWIRPGAYYRALASDCGASFFESDENDDLDIHHADATPRNALKTNLLRCRRNGRASVTFAPGGISPQEIKNRLATDIGRVAITTPRDLRAGIQRTYAKRLMSEAIYGLSRRYPGQSAGEGLVPGQRLGLAVACAFISASAILAPILTLYVLAGLVTLFFGMVVALRLVACINMFVSEPETELQKKHQRIPDAELPVYTLLVPLFHEAEVLEGLTRALMRLDYPAAKLDIKLIFESVDEDTLAKAKALSLPANFEFVVVPDAKPRTKPKALNYALQFARGEFVVIYDAEDRPEPGQLHKALAAFRAGPPNLACVQARLTIYNAAENWLTKQFAIEYAALFSGLLPALQRLGLPIPLGGTSNHFRTLAIKWLGAWDAFNVTEDADLGMRLYRHGYICRMLDSETREEAPCHFKAWLCQRTRWMKGWMQTYFVHMRHPVQLWREFGTSRFLGFQIMVGGVILSSLAHPAFYVLVALELSSGTSFMFPANIISIHIWLVALFNVVVGFTASMFLALIILRRQGVRFTLHILMMPAYWLLMSCAAYRAVLQLLTRPFHWEKTDHGVSRYVTTPSPATQRIRDAKSAG
jgi:cellulose synthase/poly-beta-1,6-N-acetylglucosamine synthase-like glycosyltransferase